ncbi:MAG: aminotransferase class IV [Meiothermus ruber]|uniref:aminotransferase class IV n=1 Tax=Meiothermus ruber TaxID=277 RepID=UPI00055B7F66|nr:aminotransferase class IV [Meiothermus ruber]MCL6528561.1 aminotransferase class IV [Meiothermus ruber]MCX8088249.1 aminotransferase class IV [Meiothermus ruber]GIW31947.1 MAG: D-alanine aminotransferase [Meiothermus sp.]GIW32464.1 MAG: D-alanine aminotransferase [Meiothermus sp.]
MKYASINGTIIEHDKASLHISDLGLRRGYAVFEFFRILRGVPVFLEDHLERFERSARLLELTPPFGREKLEGLIRELIELNNLREAGIQMLLTGGYSPDAFTPGQPNLIIAPMAVTPPPAQLYQQGGKVILHQNLRELPEAKTTDYLVAVKLAKRVRAEGATEVIYHDGKTVYEGGRSSLLIIQQGTLITAQAGVLPGITRKHLLEVARPILPIQERPITLAELYSADEVLLTGATRQVMPITQIEDRRVGDGQVGPYSQQLMKAFQEHLEAYLNHRMVLR